MAGADLAVLVGGQITEDCSLPENMEAGVCPTGKVPTGFAEAPAMY
jgi:hypothetical protein